MLAAVACAAALTTCTPAGAQTGGQPLFPKPHAPTPLIPPAPTTPPSIRAFEGDAMWIWVLGRSSGGSPDRIAARGRRHGLEFVVLKGAEGTTRWRQVSPRLVRALKARGLRVCAYQFIHGRRPRTEARVAAKLARTVDCLMIDAETPY